jgi:nucleotide-binding universal stress UspA family protein
MKKILLAVDGSDHSMRAARMAGELSSQFDATVDVLNVVPEARLAAPIAEYAELEHVYITQRDLLKSAGSGIVAKASTEVADAGGSVRNTVVEIGSPARTIVEYAEAWGADCIVMGRRGLGDIKGLLMGSVSHRVGQLSDRTLVTTD